MEMGSVMTSLGRWFRMSRDPIDWPPCSSAAFRRSIGRPALVTVRPGASGMGGSAGMGVTSPDQSVILGATCATGGARFRRCRYSDSVPFPTPLKSDNTRLWDYRSSGRRSGSASIPPSRERRIGRWGRRGCKTTGNPPHPAGGCPRWPSRRCHSGSVRVSCCRYSGGCRRRPSVSLAQTN